MIIIGHADCRRIRAHSHLQCQLPSAGQHLSSEPALCSCFSPFASQTFQAISIRSVAYHLWAPFTGKKINKFFVIRCLNQIQICQVLRSIQSATDHLCKKHFPYSRKSHSFQKNPDMRSSFDFFRRFSLCIKSCFYKKKFV